MPLFQAHFTPDEGTVVVKKNLAYSSKQKLSSIIYFDSVESFRINFMKQEGILFFV